MRVVDPVHGGEIGKRKEAAVGSRTANGGVRGVKPREKRKILAFVGFTRPDSSC